MLRLQDTRLPTPTQRVLSRWQRAIDTLENYEDRVAEAKRTWKNRSKSSNKTFGEVRRMLTEMCSGARRCCYCEDSYADEIEHIWPKDLYPDQAYLWRNYLFACGPCNGPKNNKFAVFSNTDGAFIDVTRPRSGAIVEPVDGEAVLIDPRSEDPLDFLELDILGTFFILPRAEEGTIEYRRAKYTVDVLRLNSRDLVVTARQEAFSSYRARIQEYVGHRDAGANKRRLNRLIRALQGMHHPFVWAEMKRSGSKRSDLARLFAAAPEALTW